MVQLKQPPQLLELLPGNEILRQGLRKATIIVTHPNRDTPPCEMRMQTGKKLTPEVATAKPLTTRYRNDESPHFWVSGLVFVVQCIKETRGLEVLKICMVPEILKTGCDAIQ